MKLKINIKNKSKIINIFFIVILATGITLLVINNKDEFYKYKIVLQGINYFYISIILVLTISASIFRSWRWYYLLIPIKSDISWRNVLRVTINALAANYSTPGKLGIPAKAVLLKQSDNVDVGKSLPSILGELFVEHSSEISLALICVLIGGHLQKLFRVVKNIFTSSTLIQNILIMISIVMILIVISIIFKKKFKSLNFFNKLSEAIRLTGKRADCIGYSYLITTINLIISYFSNWLLFAALGYPEIPYTFIVFAGTITNIVGLMSPLPGGLGVRELTTFGLYNLYFGLGGIAFLAMLIMRVITYLALFLLFLMERLLAHRLPKMGWGESGI
ncbi:flippase-like domain-containing protein [candidate division KSB1 bacterium]|nr:flippase-like domain-containing protein [candidate division KSB1 bacterium]